MIRMNDDEFAEFCSFIHTKYGINLIKKRVLIEYRLMNELKRHQAGSFTEYLSLLKNDKDGEMEKNLVNRITTNYTFFLREPSHFEFIIEHILPDILQAAPYHIWVAGCSSGEECYSLAMYLEDYKRSGKGPLPPYIIHGTDINTSVLETARQAVYPLDAIKKLPEHWQREYCICDEKHNSFTITKMIKAHVIFHYQNLIQPYKKSYFNLIMCRNVLIYFDEQSRMQILNNFDMSLMNDGYLILGHAESIPYHLLNYKYHKSSIYEKSGVEHE